MSKTNFDVWIEDKNLPKWKKNFIEILQKQNDKELVEFCLEILTAERNEMPTQQEELERYKEMLSKYKPLYKKYEDELNIEDEADKDSQNKDSNKEESADKNKEKPKVDKVLVGTFAGIERIMNILRNRAERSMPDQFGSLIKHIRQEKGMSLKEVSELSGISQSYINRIEKGERKKPSYSMIERLAEALDVDTNKLLSITHKESQEFSSAEEVLLKNTFKVNDKVASAEISNALVAILKHIHQMEWSQNSKVEDSIKLYAMVDNYKNLIKN